MSAHAGHFVPLTIQKACSTRLLADDGVKLMTEITLLASKVIPQVTSLCVAVKWRPISFLHAFRELLLCHILFYTGDFPLTNTMSNTCAHINLRAEYIVTTYVNKNIHSVLLLHNEILSHPSVNTAYQSEGSFTFTHLGRPAELDPPQVRPWPVAFTFCGIFLPLCSSSSSCFFHVYISRKTHETDPVKPATNFPPNSFESRDCCHNLTATDQLSRFTYRCRDWNAQWVQNAIWLLSCLC